MDYVGCLFHNRYKGTMFLLHERIFNIVVTMAIHVE